MDETYGTYVDDECFDIHDYHDDTDHDTDDDTEDGGRGNLYITKVSGCCCEYFLRQQLKEIRILDINRTFDHKLSTRTSKIGICVKIASCCTYVC